MKTSDEHQAGGDGDHVVDDRRPHHRAEAAAGVEHLAEHRVDPVEEDLRQAPEGEQRRHVGVSPADSRRPYSVDHQRCGEGGDDRDGEQHQAGEGEQPVGVGPRPLGARLHRPDQLGHEDGVEDAPGQQDVDDVGHRVGDRERARRSAPSPAPRRGPRCARSRGRGTRWSRRPSRLLRPHSGVVGSRAGGGSRRRRRGARRYVVPGGSSPVRPLRRPRPAGRPARRRRRRAARSRRTTRKPAARNRTTAAATGDDQRHGADLGDVDPQRHRRAEMRTAAGVQRRVDHDRAAGDRLSGDVHLDLLVRTDGLGSTAPSTSGGSAGRAAARPRPPGQAVDHGERDHPGLLPNVKLPGSTCTSPRRASGRSSPCPAGARGVAATPPGRLQPVLRALQPGISRALLPGTGWSGSVSTRGSCRCRPAARRRRAGRRSAARRGAARRVAQPAAVDLGRVGGGQLAQAHRRRPRRLAHGHQLVQEVLRRVPAPRRHRHDRARGPGARQLGGDHRGLGNEPLRRQHRRRGRVRAWASRSASDGSASSAAIRPELEATRARPDGV